MAKNVTPRGLICSLALVPNPRDLGEFQALEALITRVQPAVAGLFLDPMFWSPDGEDYRPVSASLLEEVIGLVRPDLPLWVRITGKTAEQTIHICSQLEMVCRGLNYKGPLAWVDTPLFYHSNRGLPQHYRTLLAATQFGLLADNNPQLIARLAGRTKRKNIRTSVLQTLSQEPRVVGLLHRGDLNRSINYQRAVRGRSHFLVYDATERGFLERPSASGVVSVGANLVPHEWQTITMASLNFYESHQNRAGRFSHLWEIGQRIRFVQQEYSHSPARIIPAVLAAWGLIQESGEQLGREEQEAVERILEHVPEP